MGHCEMLLAVAGMSQDEVNVMTRRLAGNWSDFPPAERAAFEFTRKQAEAPESVTDADVLALERACGKERAWHVIWYAASRHYMTKVADAFQFPLERDNPFQALYGTKPKDK
jgi:hypothetical protein